MECHRWHRIGEKCEGCGYIGVPGRFYLESYGGGPSQEEAEAAYIKWARENGVMIKGLSQVDVTGGSMSQVLVTENEVSQVSVTGCTTCGREFEGHGRECPACRKRRSRLHTPI